MAPARGTAFLIALAGVGLILGGVLLLVLAPSASATFGWFAYEPLQETRPARSVVVLGPQQCLGAGVLGVGIVVSAVLVGYRWGRARAGRAVAP